MNYKIMRSGYFHILKRIQLFTDIGEHPLKNKFLKLWAISLNEVLKLGNTCVFRYFCWLDNQVEMMKMKTSEDEMEENHLNLDFFVRLLENIFKTYFKFDFFLWLRGSLPNKFPSNKPDENVKKNKGHPLTQSFLSKPTKSITLNYCFGEW